MSEGRQWHTQPYGFGKGQSVTPHSIEDLALSLADCDLGDADGVAFWDYIVDGNELTDGQMDAVVCWCMGYDTIETARILRVCKERAAQQVLAGLTKAYRHFNGHNPPPGLLDLRYLRGDKPKGKSA